MPDLGTPSAGPAVVVLLVMAGSSNSNTSVKPCIQEVHISSAFMLFKWLLGKTMKGLFGEEGG